MSSKPDWSTQSELQDSQSSYTRKSCLDPPPKKHNPDTKDKYCNVKFILYQQQSSSYLHNKGAVIYGMVWESIVHCLMCTKFQYGLMKKF